MVRLSSMSNEEDRSAGSAGSGEDPAILARLTEELGRDTTYQVREVLARTARTAVLLADEKRFQRAVVMKWVHPEGPEDVSRLEREARLLAGLSHPHIVRLLDLVTTSLGPCLVYPFETRVSLARLMEENGRLHWRRACRIARGIAEGLVGLHEAGIAHRDIKPQNVIIITEDHARLIDLGLARGAASASLTAAGEMMGTPRYIAPETVLSGKADHRSDLYSLGLILFEMLQGRPAFAATGVRELLGAQVNEELPVSFQKDDSVPLELRNLVLWLTQKDSGARPSNSLEVVNHLADLESGDGPSTRRPIPDPGTLRLPELGAATAVIPPAPPAPRSDRSGRAPSHASRALAIGILVALPGLALVRARSQLQVEALHLVCGQQSVRIDSRAPGVILDPAALVLVDDRGGRLRAKAIGEGSIRFEHLLPGHDYALVASTVLGDRVIRPVSTVPPLEESLVLEYFPQTDGSMRIRLGTDRPDVVLPALSLVIGDRIVSATEGSEFHLSPPALEETTPIQIGIPELEERIETTHHVMGVTTLLRELPRVEERLAREVGASSTGALLPRTVLRARPVLRFELARNEKERAELALLRRMIPWITAGTSRADLPPGIAWELVRKACRLSFAETLTAGRGEKALGLMECLAPLMQLRDDARTEPRLDRGWTFEDFAPTQLMQGKLALAQLMLTESKEVPRMILTVHGRPPRRDEWMGIGLRLRYFGRSAAPMIQLKDPRIRFEVPLFADIAGELVTEDDFQIWIRDRSQDPWSEVSMSLEGRVATGRVASLSVHAMYGLVGPPPTD